MTGDRYLRDLIAEVRNIRFRLHSREWTRAGVLLPIRLRSASGILSFVSTVTLFGTPHDITLRELAIETFFPADDFTAAELSRLSAS